MQRRTMVGGRRGAMLAWLSIAAACSLACENDATRTRPGAEAPELGKLALPLSAEVAPVDLPPVETAPVEAAPVEAAPAASEPAPPPDTAPPPLGLPPGDLLVQALTSTQVSVASDGTNRCLAGGFSGSIQLGGVELVSRGERDIFVSRWVGSELSWAIRLGGEGDEVATGVALGADSSCVIAGLFRDAVNLGGTELQAAPIFNTGFDADPPGQYSAFVAQVVQTSAIDVNDDLLLAARARAPRANARPIRPVDPVAIGLLSRVVVSGARAIRGPLLPLGSSVGVSVEPAGRVLLALPEGSGVVLGTPEELNQRPFIIPLQCLAPDYEFDLCSGSSSHPKINCITVGRDATTRDELNRFCTTHAQCCTGSDAVWTSECATAFAAASGVCQCQAVAALLSPPGGELPRQESCCNSVTESVCQLRPRCCTRKWDATCAQLAASAQPLCE